MIVPAHGEAERIRRMLGKVPGLVDAVFVVDDASRDRTAELARGMDDARVTVIEHAQNRGVGAAIVSGYHAALDAGHDLLVVMAGDDQMDPADLPALLDVAAGGGARYVKGNRFLHAERRRMPLVRRLGGRALSALTRYTTGLDVDDTQCGYTVLTAAAARRLPLHDLWPRYGYPNDLLALCAARGVEVREVTVRPVYAGESSGIRAWHLLTVAGVVLRRHLWVGR